MQCHTNTVKNNHVMVNMLNVQYLTQRKLLEIENHMTNKDIFLLLETHKKRNELKIEPMNRCIQKFREIGDKKGGGFMILWKDKINRRMIEIKTKHSDIMLIKFHEGVNVFYMLVVYMATNDNSRNKIILAELRTIIKKYEDDELFILGDFNSHLGFLGPQKINLNGHNILKLINEMDLILIYDDPLCVGEITWQQNNHKSAIDFILANPKIYPRIVKMFIDEQSEDLDISDHKLITMEIKISRENNNISKKNETVSFF